MFIHLAGFWRFLFGMILNTQLGTFNSAMSRVLLGLIFRVTTKYITLVGWVCGCDNCSIMWECETGKYMYYIKIF